MGRALARGVIVICGSGTALAIAVLATSLAVAIIGLAVVFLATLLLVSTVLPTPGRVCPQCGRSVPVGNLACGPCGFSFVLHARRSTAPYWPPSPVRLPPTAAPPQLDASTPPAPTAVAPAPDAPAPHDGSL